MKGIYREDNFLSGMSHQKLAVQVWEHRISLALHLGYYYRERFLSQSPVMLSQDQREDVQLVLLLCNPEL